MGVYYMRHFVHGTKVACTDAEVKYDESLGWVQYDPVPAPIEVTLFTPEVNALAEPLPKRNTARKHKE